MQVFAFLLTIWLIITFIGHVSWVVIAAVFRFLFGARHVPQTAATSTNSRCFATIDR